MILGVIMSILDTTIVNVALETLSRELDAPLSTIQWVSTGYLLALATVIPLTGWMTERFGSKRIWMISVALFGLGSALCGLAWSAESLIFFRVLQGFGGGMIMPIGMALLAQTAGAVAGRAGDERDRRADAARADPRAGDRRPDRRHRLVALDLLRQRADRGGRAGAGGPAAEGRRGPRRRGRLDWRGLALLSPGLAG